MNPRVVLAIVVASVLVRVAYFAGLAGTPCPEQHRWEQSDMAFFHAWAGVVAGGDWLTDQALHPEHAWHPGIADRETWQRWYGGKRFHQEPLYAYLVAATYALAGGAEPRFVFVWQLVLGVLTNLLVYAVARRAFGAAVGAVAGGLAVLCGPLVFYEMVLLRASVIAFTGLLLVWLLQRALERRTGRRWALLGAALGAAVSLKLIFLVMLGAALAARPRRPRLVALATGLVLALTPLAARNLAVGVAPHEISSIGAMAFINANAVDTRPETGVLTSRFAPQIMRETGGALLPAMRAALGTHPGPGSVVRLLGRKLAVAWHWYEMPNNANFYYYGLHASVLRWLPVRFSLVGPAALLGLVLALARGRTRRLAAPLLALVACHLLALLSFEVLARYRAPLTAVLLPFAALGWVGLWRWLRERRLARLGGGLLVLAAGAALTLRPLPGSQPLIRSVDYRTPYGFYYKPRVEAAWARGDREEADRLLAASLRVMPQELKAGHALARFFAGILRIRAQNLRELGRVAEAEDLESRAATLTNPS